MVPWRWTKRQRPYGSGQQRCPVRPDSVKRPKLYANSAVSGTHSRFGPRRRVTWTSWTADQATISYALRDASLKQMRATLSRRDASLWLRGASFKQRHATLSLRDAPFDRARSLPSSPDASLTHKRHRENEREAGLQATCGALSGGIDDAPAFTDAESRARHHRLDALAIPRCDQSAHV